MAVAASKLDRVFQLLYGRKPGQAEPAQLKPARKVADHLYKLILPQSKAVIREIVTRAARAGLPQETLQYIFFLFTERPKEWPPMPADQKQALMAARSLVQEANDVPTYTDGLQLPPESLEGAIDGVLQGVGAWAAKTLGKELRGAYKSVLKRYAPEFQAVLPDSLDKRHTLPYLEALFESLLANHPRTFTNGHFLTNIVNTFL
jgi:hypothetical protein